MFPKVVESSALLYRMLSYKQGNILGCLPRNDDLNFRIIQGMVKQGMVNNPMGAPQIQVSGHIFWYQ